MKGLDSRVYEYGDRGSSMVAALTIGMWKRRDWGWWRVRDRSIS